MATTSIWAVKGWLGKVVVYVENPDKTENPASFEKQGMTERQTQGLSDVIDYAAQTNKTRISDEHAEIMRYFISGVNCRVETARDEMLDVKNRHSKTDGIVAYHGYQSFAPGEATPEMAHEIGVKLAERLWGSKYQVLVTTHLDKANHLHNHFVLNNVSMLDGKKFHRTKQAQHNCVSDSTRYSGSFIPILHEYVLLLKKDAPLIYSALLTSRREADIRDMPGATWRDILADAMEDFKRAASLESIYAKIEIYKRAKEQQHWKDKVRQTLRYHPDLFCSPSRGVWALTKYAA